MPISVATEDEFNSLTASVQAIASRVTATEADIVKLKDAQSPLPTPTPIPASTTAVYIPLFMGPGTAWNTVVSLKQKYLNQTIIVCFNPSNGNFTGRDTNMGNGLINLKNSGTKIQGYCYTGYGNRPMADVQKVINNYKQFYPEVSGIFLDEMSNSGGKEQYYKDITNFCHSNGFNYVMGNPGTSSTLSYVDTVDNVLVYESAGAPSLATVQQRTFNAQPNKSKYGIIPYGVPTLDPAYVKSVKPYLGTLYITNDSGSNPWDTIPSYLEQLIQALQ